MTDLPTKFSSFSTWETSVTPLFNVYIKHGYCPEARLKDEDVKVIINSVTCGASIQKVGKSCGSGEKIKEEKTQIKTKTETKIINSKAVVVRTESWVVDGIEIIEIFHDDVLGIHKL